MILPAMRKTLVFSLIVLLSLPAYGETLAVNRPVERHGRGKWWKISTVLLAAATSIDAASSWGRQEANPLLRGGNGQFGGQAIALKALVFGGAAGAQYFLLKRHPKAEKYATITNVILAGAFSAAAASNYARHSGGTANASPVPSNPR
ncbi:MAG: hypothetical protein IANPNBLG_02251 [Bryobacteraceae bacterium]|nr:hypothetical protein [Bryobacteraceae bacterium]